MMVCSLCGKIFARIFLRPQNESVECAEVLEWQQDAHSLASQPIFCYSFQFAFAISPRFCEVHLPSKDPLIWKI